MERQAGGERSDQRIEIAVETIGRGLREQRPPAGANVEPVSSRLPGAVPMKASPSTVFCGWRVTTLTTPPHISNPL